MASNRSVRELGCQGCSNYHWNIADSLASKAVANLKIVGALSSLIDYLYPFGSHMDPVEGKAKKHGHLVDWPFNSSVNHAMFRLTLCWVIRMFPVEA